MHQSYYSDRAQGFQNKPTLMHARMHTVNIQSESSKEAPGVYPWQPLSSWCFCSTEWAACLPVCPPVCLSVCLSTCLSLCLPVCVCVQVSGSGPGRGLGGPGASLVHPVPHQTDPDPEEEGPPL